MCAHTQGSCEIWAMIKNERIEVKEKVIAEMGWEVVRSSLYCIQRFCLSFLLGGEAFENEY